MTKDPARSSFLVAVLMLPIGAMAQTSSSGTPPDEPEAGELAKETTAKDTSEVVAKAGEDSGFWIFPEPAPFTGAIVTDRPGFSDSAGLVPRGRFQFEFGYSFTYDKENDHRLIDHLFPELGFRTGLTDWMEFRLNWAGESFTEANDYGKSHGRHVWKDNHFDGARDMSVGAKLPILKHEEGGWMPNLSFIATLGLPTGTKYKGADDVVPQIKFPWNLPITERFTVYGSASGALQDLYDGQFWQTAATLAGGYKIAERATLYLEYFGVYPANRTQDCLHLLSAGPIFRITDDISLDMRASLGLNEQAPDFQTSIGFGFRF